jgi:Bacterial regulatory proteins, gntR family
MSGRRVEPAYLRIAGMLRAYIAGGRFAAGAKLPSETQLMMRHEGVPGEAGRRAAQDLFLRLQPAHLTPQIGDLSAFRAAQTVATAAAELLYVR